VVLIIGKGGVGKTTVAAGLAAAEAKRRGKAALVEFGDGEAGRRALGTKHREVDHVVLEPQSAITRLGGAVVGSDLLARAVLDNFAISRFLGAAPAVRELAMLENVRAVSAERPDRRVFVDMPATGHGVAWLRVPAQMRTLLGSGPLFDVTDRLCRELVAPGRVSIVLCTLPEHLVILETLELWQAMTREVGLSPSRLVINRFPPDLSPEAVALARRASERAEGEARAALDTLVVTLEARAAAWAEASAVQDRAARETGVPPLVLPQLPVDADASAAATWLAGALP